MARAPLVISHAACAGEAPENTLAGIQAALAADVDGVEIDVRSSADGVPVLIHDVTLDRTTDGSGLVIAHSFAELRKLDAGARGFEGRFAGEPIPSLAEAAALTRDRCLLVVEIKQPGIAAAVVNVLRRVRALATAMAWSFDAATVAEAHELEPALPAALLAPSYPRASTGTLDQARRFNLDGVSLHYSAVDSVIVQAAHQRALSVYAWTADDPAEQRHLAGCEVDGIVSNHPTLLRRTLAAA